MYDLNAHIAKIHFYFSVQITKDLARIDESIGDLFGYGEDNFIVDLYPYSKIIHDEIYAVDILDSKVFEICKRVSDTFWESVFLTEAPIMEKEMPNKEQFTEQVIEIIKQLLYP